MDALEKEPLLINSRKNQDKKIFFEYKPLLNISRTNFDLKSVKVLWKDSRHVYSLYIGIVKQSADFIGHAQIEI